MTRNALLVAPWLMLGCTYDAGRTDRITSQIAPISSAICPACDHELQSLTAAGYEPLFFSKQVISTPFDASKPTSAEVEHFRDPRLQLVPFEVTSIPVGPLSAQLGDTVESRVLIEQLGEDSTTVATRILAIVPHHALPAGVGPRAAVPQQPGPAQVRLHERILDDMRSAVAESEANSYFITLVFSPAISPDAPDRVNWLSDLRQFGSRREAILDAELNLRQPEIGESIDAGLAKLHGLGVTCRLEGRMASTNGVVLRNCTAGDIEKIADHADWFSDFSFANPPNEPHALNGGQLRSIQGMQTRIAVNLDELTQYSGEGPTAASGDNVVVALIDEEGFFGAERHPAYYDIPNPGMTCGTISAGFSSRVVGFGCNTSTCTPGTHWGTLPGNHGIMTMAPFSSIMEGQDPCFTSSTSKEARSHGAFEATLRVHRNDPGAAQERKAMEFAALGGAHIISLSQGSGYTSCNNPRGFNTNITAAADFVNSLDVVLVRSAGNNVAACNDNCYITANASVRPEIITVGAMFDSIGAGNYIGWPLMDERFTNMNLTPNCSTPCPSSTACWSSSIGGANLRIAGGTVPNARGI